MAIVASFCALCLLLALGKFIRVKIRLLQRMYLPSSVIAGLIGLAVVYTLNHVETTEVVDGVETVTTPYAEFAGTYTAGWSTLPGFLINIVFASLFLGVTIPGIRAIWRISGPQLAYGQIVAWGQYVVGIGLAVGVLASFWELSAGFGGIVAVGFEGGHGTAAGLEKQFLSHGWQEGKDFGLAAATIGLVSAVVTGMILVNWAARRGHTHKLSKIEDMPESSIVGVFQPHERPSAGKQTVSADSVDTLALHLAIIGIAIFIGYAILTGLQGLEDWITLELYHGWYPAPAEFAKQWAERKPFMSGFPLFPLAMIGGLFVQILVSKFAKVNVIDHELMQRLSGTSLDFLVIAALSTIRLDAIGEKLVPLLIVCAGGIVWNVFCVVYLARRLLPTHWFERSIAEMGQSMGVTATGLLLLRVVDPKSETDAPSAFGYKQLMHEPFMGGGLWTSTAIPIAFIYGPWTVFGIACGAIFAWLVVWALLFRGKEAPTAV
ncbi:MAG: sodium:glutamate symporter [Planctomycetes bacterium]|nr:sodium:glutamate symporter [Planctomycetota bacterium]